MHKIFQKDHFDAENYDIFGYRVKVTSCADANVLPQDIRLLCLGEREEEKCSSFTITFSEVSYFHLLSGSRYHDNSCWLEYT